MAPTDAVEGLILYYCGAVSREAFFCPLFLNGYVVSHADTRTHAAGCRSIVAAGPRPRWGLDERHTDHPLARVPDEPFVHRDGNTRNTPPKKKIADTHS